MSRLVAPAFSQVPRQPSASVPSPSLPAGSGPSVATSRLPPPQGHQEPHRPRVFGLKEMMGGCRHSRGQMPSGVLPTRPDPRVLVPALGSLP